MKLLIDGYNLMGRSRSDGIDLQDEREALIDRLVLYQRKKKAAMTVVFDGWDRGMPLGSKERRGSLSVVFSRQGEKADQVIMRMIASSEGTQGVVVSSDREIAGFARAHGWETVSAAEFEQKLWELFYQTEYGKEDGEDEEESLGTAKKGNPRKLSKTERRKQTVLRKL